VGDHEIDGRYRQQHEVLAVTEHCSHDRNNPREDDELGDERLVQDLTAENLCDANIEWIGDPCRDGTVEVSVCQQGNHPEARDAERHDTGP